MNEFEKCQEDDIKEAIEDAGFDAEILAKIASTSGGGASATAIGHFQIHGMTCASCVKSVERLLTSIPGVVRASVALSTEMGEVEYDPNVATKQDILNALDDGCWEAELIDSTQRDKLLMSIDGAYTPEDSESIKTILGSLKGVRQFVVDYEARKVEVLFDPEITGVRTIVDAVEGPGEGDYSVKLPNPYTSYSPDRAEEVREVYHLLKCALCFSVSSSSNLLMSRQNTCSGLLVDIKEHLTVYAMVDDIACLGSSSNFIKFNIIICF